MWCPGHRATTSLLFGYPRLSVATKILPRELGRGENHLAPDRDYTSEGPSSPIENVTRVPECHTLSNHHIVTIDSTNRRWISAGGTCFAFRNHITARTTAPSLSDECRLDAADLA